jgi:hypothetical protein
MSEVGTISGKLEIHSRPSTRTYPRIDAGSAMIRADWSVGEPQEVGGRVHRITGAVQPLGGLDQLHDLLLAPPQREAGGRDAEIRRLRPWPEELGRDELIRYFTLGSVDRAWLESAARGTGEPDRDGDPAVHVAVAGFRAGRRRRR